MSGREEVNGCPIDRPVRCRTVALTARHDGDPQPYWESTVPPTAGTNTPNPASGRGTT